MPITLIYMAPVAYLLFGCLLMLAANEFLHGCVTRMEFVRGMILWPVLLVYVAQNCYHDFRVMRRARRRARG